jgi:hypothetical protein
MHEACHGAQPAGHIKEDTVTKQKKFQFKLQAIPPLA